LNLALDYLPGSVTFDRWCFNPMQSSPPRSSGFDAFVCTWIARRGNCDMLMWHRRAVAQSTHGAALYFHHAWNSRDEHAQPRSL